MTTAGVGVATTGGVGSGFGSCFGSGLGSGFGSSFGIGVGSGCTGFLLFVSSSFSTDFPLEMVAPFLPDNA